LGYKRTWQGEFAFSALPAKADMFGATGNVRFVPETNPGTAAILSSFDQICAAQAAEAA